MKITLIGLSKLNESLDKRKKINTIIRLWMKSGKPDEIMQKSFETNFELEGRPQWKSLSKMTIKDRKSSGFGAGPILKRTGELKKSVVSMKGKTASGFSKNSIEWGVEQLSGLNKEKFKAHQAGMKNPISKFNPIPQRKMILFQKKDAKDILTSVGNWVNKQLK